jgi:FkbM family methyltransferase
LRVIPRGTVLPVLTGRLAGARWIVGAGIHRCWLGTYEIEKQRVLEAFVRPGMVVFDVGAHAGFYSLLFARLVGAGGQVWAFEPNVENAAYLVKHVHLNRAANVTVMRAAVSAAPELGHFRLGSDSYLGRLAPEGDYRVPTVSLDNLLKRHAAPYPDLIKIDVEGAEAAVLAGAAGLLRERRPILFVALHGAQAAADCAARLKAHRYGIFSLAGTPCRALEEMPPEIYAVPV